MGPEQVPDGWDGFEHLWQEDKSGPRRHQKNAFLVLPISSLPERVRPRLVFKALGYLYLSAILWYGVAGVRISAGRGRHQKNAPSRREAREARVGPREAEGTCLPQEGLSLPFSGPWACHGFAGEASRSQRGKPFVRKAIIINHQEADVGSHLQRPPRNPATRVTAEKTNKHEIRVPFSRKHVSTAESNARGPSGI